MASWPVRQAAHRENGDYGELRLRLSRDVHIAGTPMPTLHGSKSTAGARYLAAHPLSRRALAWSKQLPGWARTRADVARTGLAQEHTPDPNAFLRVSLRFSEFLRVCPSPSSSACLRPSCRRQPAARPPARPVPAAQAASASSFRGGGLGPTLTLGRGGSSRGAAMQRTIVFGAQPQLDCCVHVDVVAARGLLPMDRERLAVRGPARSFGFRV